MGFSISSNDFPFYLSNFIFDLTTINYVKKIQFVLFSSYHQRTFIYECIPFRRLSVIVRDIMSRLQDCMVGYIRTFSTTMMLP